MSRWGWLFALTALTMVAGGCGGATYTSPERYERGLVVCLSGAGGMMGEVNRIRNGLSSGGVDLAIEAFNWSRGGVFGDQMDVAENRRRAMQLAARVETYLKNRPGRPVHLIGVSAGTGLVVWALENLQGVRATGAVLIASSLDAHYDLSRALRNVNGHIYSFNSVADTVLTLGVTLAGTVDRGGGIGGGLVGFSPPDGASEATKQLYQEKLKQFSWNPSEVLLGHLGNHLGATRSTFVRVRIAPLILGKEPETADKPQVRPAATEPRTHASRRTRDWKDLP